jgi:chemotaxis protein methyltransferase CheR
VGSDIDSNVLDSARRGVYDVYALRNVSEALRRKYFTQLDDTTFQISPGLREAVSFTRVNITSAEDTRSYREFDLVFCRNLLIYFDARTRREAVQAIYGALNPGGYVFLGHSESMARISSLFRVAKASHSLIYQKPPGDAP